MIENKITLHPEQHMFLDLCILGHDFPWYCQESLYGTNHFMFAHPLMSRDGKILSEFYPMAKEIFDQFCLQNNITYSAIFRASFNCTVYSEKEDMGIHTDHEFPHKNFILYLTDVSGDTIIHADKLIRVKPERFKAVVFSGDPHTHEFCLPDERRVVMVFTFI